MFDPDLAKPNPAATTRSRGSLVREILKAKNPKFDIELSNDAEYSTKYRAVAEFKAVLSDEIYHANNLIEMNSRRG